MKKVLKVISVALCISLAFTLAVALSACNKENAIVGEWKYEKADLGAYAGESTANYSIMGADKYVFKDDGTAAADGDIFYWSYDKANKNWRISKWGKDSLADGSKEYDIVKISGKTMTVSNLYVYKKA
jgi:hypothetical protein